LQCVELDRLAVYLDSDIIPWHVDKAWEDLLPSEWFQVCTVDIRVNSEGRVYEDPFIGFLMLFFSDLIYTVILLSVFWSYL
jgi:hypothetical protein